MEIKHIKGAVLLRIGLCDNEPSEVKKLQQFVERYDSKNMFSVSSFSNGNDFVRENRKALFDVAFLDVEMETPDGFEIGKQLVKHTPHPLIIFLSKSMTYTISGYGIAFRYLIKPINFTEFSAVMDAVISEVYKDRFSFSSNHMISTLPAKSVFYIESFGHLVIIHTRQNDYTVRLSLDEISRQLPQKNFAYSHKSYFVNMECIASISSVEAILINGEKVPISRRKRKDFIKQFKCFLEK